MVSHGIVLPSRGVVLETGEAGSLPSCVEVDVLSFASSVEEARLDGIWVGDSVLSKPRLEPLSTLAAVSTITDSITLGTAIYYPQLRHPVHVAQQTATLDQLSDGRLRMGVGVGIGDDVQTEYNQLDVPYEHRGVILDESLDVLSAFWRAEPVSIKGEFFDLDQAKLGFHPPESPPRIYIASAAFDPRDGFPNRIAARIATHGGRWVLISMSTEMYGSGLERARNIVSDAGRDPSDFDAAYYQDVVVAETEADAIAQASDFHARYYPALGTLSDDEISRRGAFGSLSVIAEVNSAPTMVRAIGSAAARDTVPGAC